MNKILSFSILLAGASLFVGCAGEEESLFEKSAAERLNETSAVYTSRLEASRGGWVMEYYPTNDIGGYGGIGYLLMARFNPDHSVTMAMNNELSLNKYLEDTTPWEVITDNGPVLSFNSYNECMHTFSDPESYIRGIAVGDQGTGVGGDYEFVMVDVPENGQFIMLKGKKRGTYTRMTRIPEGTNLEEYLMDVNSFFDKMFSADAPNPVFLNMGDKKFTVEESATSVPNIYPFGKDAIAFESRHPFLITKRDGNYYMRFRSLYEIGDSTVQEFVYDPASDQFTSIDQKNFDQAVITGYPKGTFFEETIQNGRVWSNELNASASDNFKDIMSRMASAFDKGGQELKSVSIQLVTKNGANDLIWRIAYNKKKSTKMNYIDFVFTKVQSGDEVTFTYNQPYDSAAEASLERVDGLQDMVNLLAQKFIINKNETDFNLRTMKLVSATDPNTWFTVTINNNTSNQ